MKVVIFEREGGTLYLFGVVLSSVDHLPVALLLALPGQGLFLVGRLQVVELSLEFPCSLLLLFQRDVQLLQFRLLFLADLPYL